MSLNIEKTHYMIFSNRGRKTSLDCDIQIGGSTIDRVSNTKFLGLIIDSHLTWKFHIDLLCRKISKNIGIILKCRKIFKQDTLVKLYNSYTNISHLLYSYMGSNLWLLLDQGDTFTKTHSSHYCRCCTSYTHRTTFY